MHGAVKLLLFVPLPRTYICLVYKSNSTNQIISILCIRMALFYAMIDLKIYIYFYMYNAWVVVD